MPRDIRPRTVALPCELMHRLAATFAALAVLLLPAAALAHAGEQHPEDLADHWWDAWSFSPLELAPFLVVGVLYGIRARHVGPRLEAWRVVSFYAGLGIAVVSIVSPIDVIAEEGLFSVHMLQHALLGGISPLLVVLGITGPVLRPLIQYRVIRQLQVLSHPAIALPLWVAVFVFWHLPPIYDLGVENELAHVVEHATFFATTALVWMSVVEPLPGPRWFGTGAKIGYLAAFWFVGLLIVNVFWFSGTAFYERYEDTAPAWGVSALQDQANAGSIFMAEHMLIVLTALVVLAVRASREGTLRQALLEHGVERQKVLQAVRYGRAAELAEQVGASTRTRAGID